MCLLKQFSLSTNNPTYHRRWYWGSSPVKLTISAVNVSYDVDDPLSSKLQTCRCSLRKNEFRVVYVVIKRCCLRTVILAAVLTNILLAYDGCLCCDKLCCPCQGRCCCHLSRDLYRREQFLFCPANAQNPEKLRLCFFLVASTWFRYNLALILKDWFGVPCASTKCKLNIKDLPYSWNALHCCQLKICLIPLCIFYALSSEYLSHAYARKIKRIHLSHVFFWWYTVKARINNLFTKIKVMIKLQASTKHALVAFQSYMSQATLDWLSGTNCITPNVNFCCYKATLGKTKCCSRDQVVTLWPWLED